MAVTSKGTLFLSAKLFAERQFGLESVDRCIAELRDEDRQLLTSGVVAVGWYPLGPIVNFHRALDRLYGRGDLALCHEIGRFSAEWQLNSFHKLVLKFKTPHWMAEKAGHMWRHYHDSGDWEIPPPQPRRVSGRLRGFALVDEAFCQRERGWFERAVELTGGKNPSVIEPQCRARGAQFCEYVGTWE